MTALEEDDAGAMSLSAPDATLESEAAASPTTRRVWLASSAISQEKWVWCIKIVNEKVEDLKARVGSDGS
jgi:hypothetical protein